MIATAVLTLFLYFVVFYTGGSFLVQAVGDCRHGFLVTISIFCGVFYGWFFVIYATWVLSHNYF